MNKTNHMVISFLLICMALQGISQNKTTGKEMDEMWGLSSVKDNMSINQKSKLFDESNFGMFIHWGLFSHLGGKWKNKTYYGIGEWIMNPRMAGIPVEEYKQIAKDFNPQKFDAKAIVQLAKDAGMKYIIIDSKHHDGFAMFKSKANSFNIVDATPFARDPMNELSLACRESGLGFGFYYSHNQDWTSPGGTGGPAKYADGEPANFENYFYEKCLPQVKEICTNYGPIDFVWFDTPGNMKKELVVELVNVVRELQPNAMLCSRVGHGMGDYASKGDMEVPSRNIDGLWETCDTNNDSWSYAWYDNNFKNTKEILYRLISTVSRGGTYLFNVGPDTHGQVPEIGAKFLREAGQWIRKYPQVVYNAGSSPWRHAQPWGDISTNKNSLFLSVFEWPRDGKLYLPGLQTKIEKAYLLRGSQSKRITFKKENDWVVLSLPCKPADSPASVVELKFTEKGKGIVVDTTQALPPNIKVELLSEFANVVNAEKKSVRWMEKFGEWIHVTQVSGLNEYSRIIWEINVFEPGYYYIDLRYKGEKKLVWKTVSDEGIVVQNQQPATEKYLDYRMGIMEFKKAGKHTLTVSLVDGNPESASFESMLIYSARD